VGLQNTVTTVREETLVFPAEFTGTVSVFCMGKPARGVTIRGLKYELIEGELTSAYPLGVSNSFVGAESRIAVGKGCVLALFDTANGMRWRYE
jgi:thiamine pyrophosphokinase